MKKITKINNHLLEKLTKNEFSLSIPYVQELINNANDNIEIECGTAIDELSTRIFDGGLANSEYLCQE